MQVRQWRRPGSAMPVRTGAVMAAHRRGRLIRQWLPVGIFKKGMDLDNLPRCRTEPIVTNWTQSVAELAGLKGVLSAATFEPIGNRRRYRDADGRASLPYASSTG